MPDPILKFSFSNAPEFVEALKSKPSRCLAVLSTKLNALMFMLETKIKMKLSGEVLRVRTGVLRGSVHAIPAQVEGNKIIGAVESSSGPAFYGRYLEFGSRPHQIMAVKARALRFVMGGKVHFAKSVAHPGSIPRSFMASTLAEEAESIKAALEQALNKEIKSE